MKFAPMVQEMLFKEKVHGRTTKNAKNGRHGGGFKQPSEPSLGRSLALTYNEAAKCYLKQLLSD